jgi:DNA-binding transcriptional MerR regulator
MNHANTLAIRCAGDASTDSVGEVKRSDRASTIGEVAKQFGISLRTLRFYESRALLRPIRRGRKRFYGQKDVERLAVILKAKRLGLTLNAIREIIVEEGSSHTLQLSREACLAQIAILERRLAQVQSALADLRAMCGLIEDRRDRQ